MSRLSLQANNWYGWQMIPGYTGQRCVPYCCPIRVSRVEPLKSGQGLLRVHFWNTGYVEGMQDFCVELKLLHRATNYLVAGLYENQTETMERCAIISHIEFGWVETFCPHLWHNHPPHQYNHLIQGSISMYLDAVFGVKS
jgi:hypothetical protein